MEGIVNLYEIKDLREGFDQFSGTEWETAIKRIDLLLGQARDAMGLSQVANLVEVLKERVKEKYKNTSDFFKDKLRSKSFYYTLDTFKERLGEWATQVKENAKNKFDHLTKGKLVKMMCKDNENFVPIMTDEEYFSMQKYRQAGISRDVILDLHEDILQKLSEHWDGTADNVNHYRNKQAIQNTIDKILGIIEYNIGEKLTDANIKKHMQTIVDVITTELWIIDREDIKKIIYVILCRLRNINIEFKQDVPDKGEEVVSGWEYSFRM